MMFLVFSIFIRYFTHVTPSPVFFCNISVLRFFSGSYSVLCVSEGLWVETALLAVRAVRVSRVHPAMLQLLWSLLQPVCCYRVSEWDTRVFWRFSCCVCQDLTFFSLFSVQLQRALWPCPVCQLFILITKLTERMDWHDFNSLPVKCKWDYYFIYCFFCPLFTCVYIPVIDEINTCCFLNAFCVCLEHWNSRFFSSNEKRFSIIRVIEPVTDCRVYFYFFFPSDEGIICFLSC